MFTKRIIPCLDVNNGRVVKGVNFVDLKDAGDPVEIARAYDAAGADELVFLDITASCEERDTVVDMVRQVAANVFIPFTVGGGIRTVEDFRKLLREGADKISVNSAAIDRPELITEAAEKFGSQCVVVAIDAKRRQDGGWNIYKHGGRLDTGIDAIELPRRLRSSVRVKSFLPVWIVMAPRQDMTLSLPERSRMQFLFRSLHPEVRELWSIFMMH